MIETTIRRQDPGSGADIPAPTEVWDAIARADAVLRDALAPGERLQVTALWQPEPEPTGEWAINLELNSEGTTSRQRFPLDSLRDPRDVREQVRGAVTALARQLMRVLQGDLARIRRELGEL